MKVAGIDLGSRTIKVVVVDATGEIIACGTSDTTFDPLQQCGRLLANFQFDRIQATGYGRHLFTSAYEAPVVSEILAHGAGAAKNFPDAAAVLDIGGQDTKAIALGVNGKVKKFEMNDRCAAGTGKFLEVMAQAFGLPIEEFGNFAAKGSKPAKISNMCTVFAESESTALMAKGEKPRNIALGLHLSIVKRAAAMMRRVTPNSPIVFTGGVAKNPCILKILPEALKTKIYVPQHPQLIGALGAALLLLRQGVEEIP